MAVAYGLLSYLTAYLKTHYPVQFMTALLTAKSDRVEKISSIINDCNRMGIKVSPPKINDADASFRAIPVSNEIIFGLMAVKGLGESVVEKIINERPYASFNDFISKIPDKAAIIALIKAGAFPTKDNMKLMKHYARLTYDKKEYKPVSSLPTKAKLLIDWNIDTNDYKIGKKVDKEAVLKIYNKKRAAIFEEEQDTKYKVYMREFYNKYATDQFLWEFQSLSMFLTNNPLKEAYEIIGEEWQDVPDGSKAVVPCVIIDIKRKKDKNNNQFAYIDLCTNNGIVEGTIWSKQLKDYYELVEKGSCISILGRKEENHLFVERIKPYKQWLHDISFNHQDNTKLLY